MSDELTDHLRRLGLDAAQTLVYAQLLIHAPATPAQLTAATGLTEPDIQHALDQLGRTGLIRALDDDSVVPLQPAVGVSRLALEREAELRAAQAAALNAYHDFRRTVWTQATDDVVEVVTGKS